MGKGELEEFSALVGAIYDASMDPRLWPAVVERMVDALGGTQGMLLTFAHTPDQGGYCFPARIAPEIMQAYAERWQGEDVWVRAVAERGMIRSGVVFIGEEVVPRRVLVKTAFYREFLTRADTLHTCFSIVFGGEEADLMGSGFAVHRSRRSRPFAAREKHWLHMLTPHLSRSLGVMQRLRNAEFKAAHSRAALDRLDAAVVLVGADGRVVFANRAALRVLESGGGLRLMPTAAGDRLAAFHADETQAIEAALASALDPGAVEVPHFSRGIRVSGGNGVNAPRTAPVVLNVSALPAQNDLGTGPDRAHAIVFLTDTAAAPCINRTLLREIYKLSPAELRLVEEICRGEPLPAIAQRLGVGHTTLRSQLGNVFSKTSTARQSDLVRLVMSLPGGHG